MGRNFNFTITDVADLLGLTAVKPFGRDNQNYICPYCGRPKLNIVKKRDVFRCPACNESGGMLYLYSSVMGMNKEDALADITERLNVDKSDGTYARSTKPKKVTKSKSYQNSNVRDNEDKKEVKLKSPDVLNKVYRRFLSLLKLSNYHRQNLHERGLTDDLIDKYMIKSVPLFNHQSITDKLVAEGYDLKGVSGFYFDYKEKKWTSVINKGYSGFFVPVFDINNKIIGMQIRMDRSISSKYIWFSSSYHNLGVSSGSPISFTKVNNDVSKLVLTEGPLKGMIASNLSKRNFLAIAGVNNQKGLKELLVKLKSQGLKLLIDAFDADCISNANVEKARQKINEMCNEVGIEYQRLQWDIKFGKGIDDFLLNRLKYQHQTTQS